MQMIKYMYKQFLREPFWFKVLVSSTLLIAIIFSTTFFSDKGYYQIIAKLATAIFFSAYGIKFRRNNLISVIFFALAVICFYLTWDKIDQTRL